jgi:hypothetical protein
MGRYGHGENKTGRRWVFFTTGTGNFSPALQTACRKLLKPEGACHEKARPQNISYGFAFLT